MAQVAAKYQEQLKRIKENIEAAYEYFRPNYDRYNKFRRFVFETSLSEDDKSLLRELKKPVIEFNVLEAFISRLRGEFSKQEPSFIVRAADGVQVDQQVVATIEVVEGHLRAILDEANSHGFEYRCYTDALSGGFSVAKMWTEYTHEKSFDQVIKNDRVYDPTMCGFDPLAKQSHKADGRYCFELFPMCKSEFEYKYPDVHLSEVKFSKNIEGFNWSYQSGKEDVVLVGDYYEKKKKRQKILKLATGETMTPDKYAELQEQWQAQGRMEQIPAIVDERMADWETICRYTIMETEVLDYEETDYDYLPLVFIDGNSIDIRRGDNGSIQQWTRPYVYQAEGVQKLKNFAGQTLANELENMIQHKVMAPVEGIPDKYREAYTNFQKATVLAYKSFKDDDEKIPLQPPSIVPRQPIPPEVTNTFTMTDQITQAILGNYDASLGINDNQLSGIAIVEGATQSNAAAMPYVVGYMQGLNQLAKLNVSMMPKIFLTPRTIPIIDEEGKRDYKEINTTNGVNMQYGDNCLDVKVEAGVNFSVQKSRTLNQISIMMKASEQFNAFVNEKCLPILVDNLEIKDQDKMKELAKEFMQEMAQHKQMAMQQAQQQSQQNPLAIRAQVDMAKLQQQGKTDQTKAQIEVMKLQSERDIVEKEHQIKIAELNLKERELHADVLAQHQDMNIQNKKANVELETHEIDSHIKHGEHALKHIDMAHQHAMDIHDRLTKPKEQSNV